MTSFSIKYYLQQRMYIVNMILNAENSLVISGKSISKLSSMLSESTQRHAGKDMRNAIDEVCRKTKAAPGTDDT